MSRHYANEPPKVTGLSPKEGVPGTKIKIRGENLGRSPEDLIGVTICGVECLMYCDWISSSKILGRSSRCKGPGDVIVTTRSGGRGTCTVQFRGYEEVVNPTTASAVWVNEEDYNFSTNRHRAASSPSLFPQDPLVLCSRESPDGASGKMVGMKLKESQLKELFPDAAIDGYQGFGNIMSENFVPTWYLLENHSQTSFKDLKMGLQSLHSKISAKTDLGPDLGPITLLKPNVLAVVECLDALKAVHLALKKDKQEFGVDMTYKIEDAVKRSTDEAHDIFDAILSRKDLADSTRNALNVLRRYRFLFNLPSSIEKSIQKGDFDVVINDYARARSLFAETQVKVFKRVYAEVEQRMMKFRNSLHEKLKASCCQTETRNVEEVKKLIRYLINLDLPGNPAWDSIVAIKETMINAMNSCRDKHLALAKSAKSTTVQLENCESQVLNGENGFNVEAPQAVQFIEEMTLIFNQFYPDLVKLGQHYLNGDLYTKETDEQIKSKEQIFQLEMIQKTINSLVNLMRAALLPQSVRSSTQEPWPSAPNETFVIWLPHCLRCIINCYHSLSKQEFLMISSFNVLQAMQSLIFDFRVHALVCLFNQAGEEVKNLCLKENWDIQMDDAIGTRTQLPLLFESKVVEILQLVRETILQTSSPDEADIFTQINVQGQMKQLAQNLLQAFIVALEKTVANEANSPTTVAKSHPDPEDRMLIVICNCIFTGNHVIPRLHESFDKYNYPDMNMVIKVAQAKYRDFELKLFNMYVERKCDSVIGAIEPSMLSAGTEWYARSTKPTDISSFVKETLMSLVEIEAQVFSIAPPLVRKVMVNIIESTVEEVARLHECAADRLSEAAALQAFLDFSIFRYLFQDIESNSTQKMLNSSRSQLKPLLTPSDSELVDKTLNLFKQRMKLQLSCFRWESESTLILL